MVVGSLQHEFRRTASGRIARVRLALVHAWPGLLLGVRVALCIAWDRTVVRLSRLRVLSVISVVYGVPPSSFRSIGNATSGGLGVPYRSDSGNTVAILFSTLV